MITVPKEKKKKWLLKHHKMTIKVMKRKKVALMVTKKR